MNEIVQVLMERDGMTEEFALQTVQQAQTRVYQGEDPEEILREEFGLEPDYIFNLI